MDRKLFPLLMVEFKKYYIVFDNFKCIFGIIVNYRDFDKFIKR
jgi:hypothetical protein